MAIEIMSLSTGDYYAPRFEIEINSSGLGAAMSQIVTQVEVEESVDEGASFSFTVFDEFDMASQTFKWLDHPLFEVGNTVKIKIGYGGGLESMMMGKITEIESSFFTGETPTLTVKGQDMSFDYMKRKSPERTFVNMSYSDIAQAVAGEAGLSIVAGSTGAMTEPIRKDNEESYFAFLERLARRVGFQFKIDGQTIYFNIPEDEKKEVLTLALGKDIISFQPRLNSTGLVAEVEVRGHNPQDPTSPIIGRATAGGERAQEGGRRTGSQIADSCLGGPRKVITDRVVTSVNEANELAKAELNRASDSMIEGDGECIGIPQIRTGINIMLEKMGQRFSGKYYVKSVTHTVDNNGYRTRFNVKRNAL